MKHDHIEPRHTYTSIPHLSDAEIEARVFRNLEARRMAWEEERECSVVVLHNAATRTVFQRLSA